MGDPQEIFYLQKIRRRTSITQNIHRMSLINRRPSESLKTMGDPQEIFYLQKILRRPSILWRSFIYRRPSEGFLSKEDPQEIFYL